MAERNVTCPRLPVLDFESVRDGFQVLDPPARRVVPHPPEDLGGRGHADIVSMAILDIKGVRSRVRVAHLWLKSTEAYGNLPESTENVILAHPKLLDK